MKLVLMEVVLSGLIPNVAEAGANAGDCADTHVASTKAANTQDAACKTAQLVSQQMQSLKLNG